jgi:hypothetical protein
MPALREQRTCRQAIKSEEAGVGMRKSEVPIVAWKPGNAGGAKGHRFEDTGTERHCLTQSRICR